MKLSFTLAEKIFDQFKEGVMEEEAQGWVRSLFF